MIPPCYRLANENPIPMTCGVESVHTFYEVGEDMDWLKTVLMVKAAELVGLPVICFTDHPHQGSVRKLYIWLRSNHEKFERVRRSRRAARSFMPVASGRLSGAGSPRIFTPQKGG